MFPPLLFLVAQECCSTLGPGLGVVNVHPYGVVNGVNHVPTGDAKCEPSVNLCCSISVKCGSRGSEPRPARRAAVTASAGPTISGVEEAGSGLRRSNANGMALSSFFCLPIFNVMLATPPNTPAARRGAYRGSKPGSTVLISGWSCERWFGCLDGVGSDERCGGALKQWWRVRLGW
jgi:hypothetical protein